jgi:hypothetical protein
MAGFYKWNIHIFSEISGQTPQEATVAACGDLATKGEIRFNL